MTTNALVMSRAMQPDLLDQTPIQTEHRRQGLAAALLPPGIEQGFALLNSLFGKRTGDGGVSVEDPLQVVYTEKALLISTAHLKAINFDNITSSPVHADVDHITAIDRIKETTGLPQYRVAQLFGVSRQSLSAWMRGESIADTKYRRVLAVYDVLRRAGRLYPKPSQLRTWLDTPLISEEHTPAQLLAMGEIDRARLLSGLSISSQLKKSIIRDSGEILDRFRPVSRTASMPSATDNDEALAAMYGDPLDDSDD